jgi:hypothetical protein
MTARIDERLAILYQLFERFAFKGQRLVQLPGYLLGSGLRENGKLRDVREIIQDERDRLLREFA